jgi:hypothetical protein
MEIEVSNGEIVDKLTILEIKKRNILDKNKLSNINKELEYLTKINLSLNVDAVLYEKLFDINKELWVVEDNIRVKENNNQFDQEFINLARKVYILNDKRAEVKREINEVTKSNFVEEKSYEKY